MDDKTKDIKDFVEIPKEYYSIEVPKQMISGVIKHRIEEKKMSLRKIADQIENFSYPQVARITSGENYNIDTLLKVLDILDLKIEIKNR